jgi:hypothetical protein
MSVRRRTPAESAPEGLVRLHPRHARERLPGWSPAPPRSGWTTDAVLEAAVSYADAHAPTDALRGRYARAATMALFGAEPAVGVSSLRDALPGRRTRWDALDVLLGRLASTDLDLEEAEEAAPF